MPEISETAPDFTLPVTGGETVTLSALKGQPVVLFFYPRDDTPGCTKESIGFSEHLDAFKAAGAAVFGISRDTMAKHDKFTAKHDLTVPLLSDEAGKEIHGDRARDLSDRRRRHHRADLAQGQSAGPR